MSFYNYRTVIEKNLIVSKINKALIHISIPLLYLQCLIFNRKEARPRRADHDLHLKLCRSNDFPQVISRSI